MECNLNTFERTYSLNQLTPIIHFQGQESGACLRASEVKPKLDRFLLNWLCNQCHENLDKLPEEWIQAEGSAKGDGSASREEDEKKEVRDYRRVSLSYQMRISQESNAEPQPIHPLYFGNMGDRNERKLALLCGGNIEIKLRSFCTGQINVNGKDYSMLDLLDSVIVDFFLTHCFGTRSNKGFGSYRVVKKNGEDVLTSTRSPAVMPPDCVAAYKMTPVELIDGKLDWNSILDDIYIISALMKGGINFRETVYSGYIQQIGIGTYGEKALIRDGVLSRIEEPEESNPEMNSELKRYKKKLRNTDDGRKTVDIHNSPNTQEELGRYVFRRAILGLTDQYNYMGIGKVSKDRQGNEKRDKRGNIKREDVKVLVQHNSIKKNDKGEEMKITRFASPVCYKPNADGLLILVKSIPKELCGQEFAFSGHHTKAIKTPKMEKNQWTGITDRFFMEYLNSQSFIKASVPYTDETGRSDGWRTISLNPASISIERISPNEEAQHSGTDQ